MSKKTIAIFTSIEGHASLAETVSETLKKAGYQIEIFSYEDPLFEIYRQIYIHKPSLFSHLYRASNTDAFEKFSKLVIKGKSSYSKKVDKFVQSVKPVAMISTYFGFNPTLEKLSLKLKIPFFNIICNPRTFFHLEVAEKAAINWVFDEAAEKEVAQIKPKAKTQSIGWLVRDKFEEKYNKSSIRKELGLDTKLPTFFFGTGSEGTSTVWQVIDPFVHSSKPAQAIVGCGRNKSMFNKLRQLSIELEENNAPIKLIALPFTDASPFMKAADLVVGKAGPNTLFEAIATQKPFFATTHISGQENGNLDIILEKQLGWVEEDPTYALVTLLDILHNPQLLQKFEKPIRNMADYNKQSKKKLLEAIDKYTCHLV